MPEPRLPGETYASPIRYAHQFTEEIGKAMMGVIYADSPGLRDQTSGGNVGSTSISAHAEEWEKFLAKYETTDVNAKQD